MRRRRLRYQDYPTALPGRRHLQQRPESGLGPYGDDYKNGRNPFQQYRVRQDWFTARKILESRSRISEFVQWLEASGSQGDKRERWMYSAAQFLVDRYQGDAYTILSAHDGDAEAVRNALCEPGDIGYSGKKADMFLRDMADWRVWSPMKNIDRINVASDANTMRVALRTGIIRTAMPLVTSYMDVYGYQYGLIDRTTQLAWRAVWEEWGKLPQNYRPAAPASMDYVLYRSIGKGLCKPTRPKCTECVFNVVCPDELRHLKPPKSISRLGMTGWESGRADAGGGGGIMS